MIERTRKRQCSRITNLKENDANTKFFHIKANGRKRKNFIQKLQNGQGWAISHPEKEDLIQKYFQEMLARPAPRDTDLNWEALHPPTQDLQISQDAFTESEVRPRPTTRGQSPGSGRFLHKFLQILLVNH